MARGRTAQVILELVDRASKSAERIRQAMERMAKATERVKKAWDLLKQAGAILAKAFAVVTGAIAAVGAALIGISKRGGAVLEAEKSFKMLAMRAGVDVPDALKRMRAATRGAVSDLDLMQNANKAFVAEMTFDDYLTALEYVQRYTKITGDDVVSKTRTMMTGLARQSPLFLDDVGIFLDAATMFEKGMTVAEKKTRFFEVVMGQMREKMGNFSDETLSVVDRIGQMQTAFKNLYDSFAKAVAANSAVNLLFEKLRDGIDNVREFMENNGDRLQRMITKIAEGFARVVGTLGNLFLDFIKGIKAMQNDFWVVFEAGGLRAVKAITEAFDEWALEKTGPGPVGKFFKTLDEADVSGRDLKKGAEGVSLPGGLTWYPSDQFAPRPSSIDQKLAALQPRLDALKGRLDAYEESVSVYREFFEGLQGFTAPRGGYAGMQPGSREALQEAFNRATEGGNMSSTAIELKRQLDEWDRTHAQVSVGGGTPTGPSEAWLNKRAELERQMEDWDISRIADDYERRMTQVWVEFERFKQANAEFPDIIQERYGQVMAELADIEGEEVAQRKETNDELLRGRDELFAKAAEMYREHVEERKRIEMEWAKEDVDAYNEALEEKRRVFEDWKDYFTGSWSDLFSDTLKGELDSFEDFFKRFADSILNAWIDMQSRMLAQNLFGDGGGLGGLLGGLFGFGSGGDWPLNQVPVTNNWSEGVVPGDGNFSIPVGAGGRTTSSTGGTTVNVHLSLSSIDTASGAEFLTRHGDQIAGEVGKRIAENPNVRRLIRGTD